MKTAMKNELQASDGSEETEIIRYYGAPWIKEFAVVEDEFEEDYLRDEQQDEARREMEKILTRLVLPILKATREHVQSLRKGGEDDEEKLEEAARKFLKKFCVVYLGAGLLHVYEAPERPEPGEKRKLIEPETFADMSCELSEKKGTKFARYASEIVDGADLNIEGVLDGIFKENAGFFFPTHVFEPGKISQFRLYQKRDSVLGKVARQRGIPLEVMKRGGVLKLDEEAKKRQEQRMRKSRRREAHGCLIAIAVFFAIIIISSLVSGLIIISHGRGFEFTKLQKKRFS